MQKLKILYIFLISFICIKPISVKAEMNDLSKLNTNYEISVSDRNGDIDYYIKKNMHTGEVTIGELPSVDPNEQNNNDIIYGKLPKLDHSKDLYNIPKDSNFFIPEVLGIIGSEDQRMAVEDTTIYPYSTIAYIEIEFPNTSSLYVGTAWIFGEKVAMTAGHCVYSEKNGGWADSIKIYPGIYYDGEKIVKPFGHYEASILHSSKNYIDSQDANYDWGLLEFDEDISQYTGTLGYTSLNGDVNGIDIAVTGYPGEKYYAMYTMDGNIIYGNDHELYYNIDTTGGQSGSPVYLNDDNGNKNIAVAIHTRAGGNYNIGTRIDKSLFNYMKKNSSN